MKLYKRILLISTSISTCTYPFFWVPNRYSPPFWCGDTHITNRCIDSWDLYAGGSYAHTGGLPYTTVDVGLSWYQTIAKGFFCDATLPTTTVHVTDAQDPLITHQNGTCYGNGSLLVGWGVNYDALSFFDFIDCMVRIGAITPAHKPAQPLGLETIYGYPSWGFPLVYDMAIGVYSWMTFGLHTSICQFHRNTTVWHVQPYFKIDHLVGVSAWFGYSYSGARRDFGSEVLFPHAQSWHMHTLHYGFEYECIQSYFPLHPRIGLYYNQYLGGKHTPGRSNFGIIGGFDVTW